MAPKSSKPSQFVPVTLAAGASTQLSFAGDQFVLFASNQPLNIRPANGTFTLYPPSTGAGPIADFAWIELQNTSGVAVSAVLWVGFSPLINYNTFAAVSPLQTGLIVPVTNGLLALTGGIQPVVAVSTPFTKAWFYGVSGFVAGVPTNNTDNVYIGKSSTQLPDIIDPGLSISISPSNGQLFDLSQIYVKGTAADGVFYTFS